MKRAGMIHRKTRKLGDRLGSKCLAVGVLESIWHLAAREFPAGNLGKISDEDICGEIGYKGDAAELIGHLLAEGWLDEHPVHRLIIHDWHDHAEDSVHLWLARNTMYFADGKKPNTTRLSVAERAKIDAEYAQCAHNVPTESHNVCAKSTLPLPSHSHSHSPALPSPLAAAEQTDVRIAALMGVGFAFGVANQLVSKYRPTADSVENYCARAMTPGINNRPAFVTSCIKEVRPIEPIAKPGEVASKKTQVVNLQVKRLEEMARARMNGDQK